MDLQGFAGIHPDDWGRIGQDRREVYLGGRWKRVGWFLWEGLKKWKVDFIGGDAAVILSRETRKGRVQVTRVAHVRALPERDGGER